jgi:hypothetical protein
MRKYLFHVLITAAFLTACDPVYDYTYRITNNSGTEVEVYLKVRNTVYLNRDSTYTVDGGETKTLLVVSHGVEPKGGPFYEDVDLTLEQLTVKRNQVYSHKNYLDSAAWDYSGGIYTAVVTEEEFEE